MAGDEHEQAPTNAKPVRGWHSPLVRWVTVGVFALGAVVAFGLVAARWQQAKVVKPVSSNTVEKEMPKDLKELAAKHLRNWGGRTPDLVLFLTGEQHNYEAPCGCSFPQYGGLERRYNLIKFLRDQGLEVVAADLGDVFYSDFVPGRPTQKDQLRLKYAMSMKALDLMEYSAICVGAQDFRMQLLDGLADAYLGKKYSYRIVAANLNVEDRKVVFPDGGDGSMIADWTMSGKKVKVALAGIIGKPLFAPIQKVDPLAKFPEDNGKIVQDVEKAMAAQKPDLRVMLYQGDEKDAKVLAEKFSSFNVILCLSPQSDPPGKATQVGQTQIVQVGWKGRFVGVVGVFRKGAGWELTFDLVLLGPEFETPKEDRAKNAMDQILEKYAADVRDKKLINLYPQVEHPVQVQFEKAKPTYVGSEKCKECHKDEYAIWKKTGHAEAFTKLHDDSLKHVPSNRRTDGECVVCHTTGFGYRTGYKNEETSEFLKGVGCESCHGPGSAHALDKNNNALIDAMSPWKFKPTDLLPGVEIKIDTNVCQKCHDSDNDPHFHFDFWRKIAHGPNAKASKKYYEEEFKKRTETK